MKIKISNQLLNIFLAVLSAGILTAEYSGASLKFLLAGCSLLGIVGIILTWKKNSATAAKIICPIIFFALGAARFFSADTLPANDISNFEGKEILISGTIHETPAQKIFSNEVTQTRFVVDVESVKIRGEEISATGAMILTDYAKPGEVAKSGRIGDKISASGKLKLPTNYKNPGQIDAVTRLKSDGITARMSADKSGVKVEEVEGNLPTKFLRFVSEIREHYRDTMTAVMSKEDAAAIFAMLFGGYAGLNPELVEEFQTTGIIHILSVSGSHMSFLAAATAYLCLLLKIPRAATVAIGIFVIGTYTLLSGMLPHVIRSGVMGILIFLATALEVEAIGARLLTLTALTMLIARPLLIFDISFQLSFCATAGLMYLAEDFRRMLYKFPRQFSYPAAMTISAQVASLPVVVWYFNQISLSSILANVFVMPILEIVIVGGILSGIIAFAIPFAGKIFFVAESLIFGVGAELNRIFAKLPFAAVQMPTLGFFAGFFYYLAIIFRRPEFFLMLLLIFVFNIFKPADNAEINFIDVGQGDCAVVLTPHGKCLLFDTGGTREKIFDVGERVVVPFLKHEGVREVDTIFLTHVHEDHSGGAGAVIKKFPVREIVTAGESKSEYAAVFGMSEKFLSNLRAGKAGEIFNIDGVEVEIIFAPQTGTGNEISNVYKIRYGEVTFLITGDLIKENEEEILNSGADVKSTVLKVGHHGSATSSGERFLSAVNPKCAVISVGCGNNFGHPRPEILERLENVHAKIFRTDKDGLIKFSTDGKNLNVEKFSDR